MCRVALALFMAKSFAMRSHWLILRTEIANKGVNLFENNVCYSKLPFAVALLHLII